MAFVLKKYNLLFVLKSTILEIVYVVFGGDNMWNTKQNDILFRDCIMSVHLYIDKSEYNFVFQN